VCITNAGHATILSPYVSSFLFLSSLPKGVPYFYFNGNDYGLSGAQDPATFISAFDKATAQ
jgi:hypothetical protein